MRHFIQHDAEGRITGYVCSNSAPESANQIEINECPSNYTLMTSKVNLTSRALEVDQVLVDKVYNNNILAQISEIEQYEQPAAIRDKEMGRGTTALEDIDSRINALKAQLR